MISKVRVLLVVAALGISTGMARAQGLPSAPVPVAPSGSATAPGASGPAAIAQPPAELPPAATLPAQPVPGSALTGPPALLPPPPPGAPQLYTPYQDRNGPLLRGDPLLDRPESPPPGWFLGLELNVVVPHIKNRLQADVTIDGSDFGIVHLPTAELDWTGAPRFELGYRMQQGCGEFLVSYRFLVTEGRQVLPGFDLDGNDGWLKSRLDLNVIDLDYASREYSLERWDMKWKAGVRFASIFFDSRGLGLFIEERTSNNFYGAGPHVGLDLWRSFNVPGLGFFTRMEAASVVGQIRQGFEVSGIADDGSLVGGATTVHHTQAVPTLGVQVGLGWSRWWSYHWSRYSLGYEFENWWYLGQAGASRAELTSQGIFFRGEFGF